jgi:hypothetical protein
VAGTTDTEKKCYHERSKAIDLLRLVFIYLTEGESFSGTAALLKLAGICSITKKAIVQPPEWLGNRKVYIADASGDPIHGSDKADYQLHYAIGLFDLGMKEMALTATETGEKASNFKTFGEKDIVMGIGAYNRYVIIVTSITDAAVEAVLDLYRQQVPHRDGIQRVKVII